MSSQLITSPMAPKVKYTLCQKPYSISYMRRHMKKDHDDQPKDIEMGDQNVSNVALWVENEKDLSHQTRDLDSFLNNKSDGEIRNAAAYAEAVYDAENQHDKEEMEMEQCLEW